MPYENPYDRLAQVFDNAVANYVQESQRQKQRDEAKADLADQRAYAELQHQKQRAERQADLREVRDYEEMIRGKIRDENRVDSELANQRAIVMELVKAGLLSPADANNPAKIAAAWERISPEAKQRLQDRAQAVYDIVKMVGQFGTMDIPGAETPEMLQGDDVFRVAGALRQKAAAARSRMGEKAAQLFAEAQQLQEEHAKVSALIDPNPTDEDINAASAQFGPAASKHQMEIKEAAAARAQMRAAGAMKQAETIANRYRNVVSQINALDNLSKAGVFLPEQPAPAPKPTVPPAVEVNPAGDDPMAAFLDPDGKKAKAKAEAAAKAKAEEQSRLASNPYSVKAQRDRNAKQARHDAAAFMDIFPSASRSNAALEKEVEGASIPSVRPLGGFSPWSTGFSEVIMPTNGEKEAKFDTLSKRRDADRAKAQELYSAFKDYIDLLPEDQKQKVAQMAALFENPAP